MQHTQPARLALAPVLALLLLLPAIGHAEIYKWVDAQGRTHYTERKADAGNARTVELKAAPPPPLGATAPQEDWRAWSRSTPSSQNTAGAPYGPSTQRPPKPLSDGRDHGTDASRCALGRDVLSGAVRHSNGKPIDAYDREVAQNDVKAFCK